MVQNISFKPVDTLKNVRDLKFTLKLLPLADGPENITVLWVVTGIQMRWSPILEMLVIHRKTSHQHHPFDFHDAENLSFNRADNYHITEISKHLSSLIHY